VSLADNYPKIAANWRNARAAAAAAVFLEAASIPLELRPA
jgi:hypothetical protein